MCYSSVFGTLVQGDFVCSIIVTGEFQISLVMTHNGKINLRVQTDDWLEFNEASYRLLPSRIDLIMPIMTDFKKCSFEYSDLIFNYIISSLHSSQKFSISYK